MKIDQFVEIMADIEKKLNTSINDFSAQDAKFLSKCRLIVSRQNSHFTFKKRLSAADIIERIDLVKDSDFKDNLIFLGEQLKAAVIASKKAQNQELTQIKKKIKKIEEELSSFPLEDLEFLEDFDIQVIFPTLKSDIIQRLKAHHLVDKTKTCMCKACIRVYLL